MDLSANDIRNYEFPNQMRGYDKDEVDGLLDQVAAALEEAKQENLKLSMEIESLKSQLAGLKQFEDTIKSAAIDARRNADMTVATAKQEAEMLISKAKSEALTILSARTRDVAEIENQITKLGLARKSYLSKIRSLIQSHLQMIEEIDTGEITDAGRDDPLTITESTDVTTEARETVATQPDKTPLVTEPTDDAAISDGEGIEESPSTRTEDMREAVRAEEPPQIDPELAAALESYKKAAAEEAADQWAPTAETPPIPPQDKVVETDSLAEDIPEGFIAREDGLPGEQATDKVPVTESKTSDPAEPSHPATDESGERQKAPLAPGDLADELDEVATRFDEEMDKAERN